jgi:hypothetical protein
VATMTAENAAAFIKGNDATFTVKSVGTGKHYTFRSKKSGTGKTWFISVLTGPDHYDYVGLLTQDDKVIMTARSRFAERDMVFRAIRFVAQKVLVDGVLPANMEVMHDGACAHCGRQLTHPTSLQTGYGPECIKKVGPRKVLICEEAA